MHELTEIDAVIGSVVPESARIENGRGIAIVLLSERADVEPIWRDIQDGHIRAVSIGYHGSTAWRSPSPKAATSSGARSTGPVRGLGGAVGADPAAGFRNHAPLHDCVLHRRDAPIPTTGVRPMTDKTQSPAAKAADETTETVATEETTTVTVPKAGASETRAQTKIQQPAKPEPGSAAPAEEAEALVTRARDAERDRISTIYNLAGRPSLERGFAEDLVKRGVAIDEARRPIFNQVAAKSEETWTFPPQPRRLHRIPAMYGNSITQLESEVVWGIITGNPAMADGKALFHAESGRKRRRARRRPELRPRRDCQPDRARQEDGTEDPPRLPDRAGIARAQGRAAGGAEPRPASSGSVVPQSLRTLAPISKPRVDPASETAWYLAASPNQIDTIEYVPRMPAGRLY